MDLPASSKRRRVGNSGKSLPAPDLGPVKVHTDDPAQHGGRIRKVPHREGTYASFVWVSVPFKGEVKRLFKNILVRAREQNQEIKWEELPRSKNHVSLSKTFYLPIHQARAIVRHIQQEICAGIPRLRNVCG